MRRLVTATILSLVIAVLGSTSWAAGTAVTPDEATNWIRHIIPLPKSIQILRKAQVACAQVSIVTPASASILIPQARKELRTALGLSEEGDNPASPAFTITLQLGGAESNDLNGLVNSGQAYKIIPESGDAGLRLVALEPAGLYYAAKTLTQMLSCKVTGSTACIPIVQILDWPDMADRGVWGCDHFAWLKWMGDRKMNIGEQISKREVRSDLKGYSYLQPGREMMVTEGPYYNVAPVPVTLHLEQVSGSGLFTYYPQVKGVGGQDGCICYSNGAFTHVLADWMVGLASEPFVEGLDVWMAENLHHQGGCQCSQCSLWNRDVLEARIIVEAWEEAKARLGRYFKLWILTSEETEDSEAAVFASLPPDVRIWYYHSLYTYTAGKLGIISDDVSDAANSGRYMGVCPSLSNIGFTQPFNSAEFINYRLCEFVDKNMSGMIGYATPPPMVNYVGYNLEGAAEWSWNVNGRTTHEFAVAYAVRKGYSDPEKFAQWADAIGKVEFDLYGSDWPSFEGKFWPGGYVADLLRENRLPAFGEAYPGVRGPWGEFKTAQQFDNDLALAIKALNLAKEMGIDEHYYESLYITNCMTALRALSKLKGLVVDGAVSAANRETARYYFGVYINSMKQAIPALIQWCTIVDDEHDPHYSDQVVPILQRCIDGDGGSNPGMVQVAADMGCTPTLPYLGEPAVTIADAKRLGEGAIVSLYGDLVTGGHGSTCFIQDPDRTCAIRVNTPTALTTSAPALVFGRVENVGGELRINAEIVQSAGSVESVKPVAVTTRGLGGGIFGGQPAVMEYRMVYENGNWVRKLLPIDGLNNLGLYVRVTGIVTYVGPDYFYIDDGGRCDDDSGNYGVRAICADGSWTMPAAGEYVTINAMSSAYFERGQTWRALYISTPSNITIIPVATEIIIDEDQATLIGMWDYASSASGVAYNDDYASGATSVVESATARWTPDIKRPGAYDVFVMYPEGTDHTRAAPYTVSYDGGAHTFAVDQTTGGGAWQFLGRRYLAAGTAGYVELSNMTADPGKVIVADAVKFVRADEGTSPGIVTQPSPQAVCAGATASFTVSAAGTSPLAYQWRKGTVDITNGGHYSGAKTNTLIISGCDASDAAANYNCLVSNIYDFVASENVALLVGDQSVAPAALPASNNTTDSITWNWASAPGAVGYTLWTAATGGMQIGGTITGTSHTEIGMDPGMLYARYVEAIYACGESTTRTQLGPANTMPRYCVENGDFEGGFTDGIGNHWIKTPDDGTSQFAQETTVVRDGTSSQRLYDPVNGQMFTGYVYQKINVQPNRGYTYKFYNRRQTTSGCVAALGVNVTGGIVPGLEWETNGNAGDWKLKSVNVTSGATGLVTVFFSAGYNNYDTTLYVDGVYLLPRAPTSTGGSKTITRGSSATITASGGFGGTNSELHWYTGPGGTGTHVGTGTSLVVSPTVTTTYYPRWESSLSGSCPSDDGTSVKITVNQELLYRIFAD